ncbi:hypothetical protein M5689_003669 [Euphorbia peplus]|nr:hypothetical protein M5689_003669 [Euphorbia peplus]
MSSSCQGLQSFLEPPLVIEPRVLRLKLAPSQPDILNNNNISSSSHNNVESGGWTFLQSLAENQHVYKDEPYNPPNSKRGSSVLSEKSLEMCTESLGSETGSDTSDEMALLSSEIPENYIESGIKHSRFQRETSRNYSFPPPLTSISRGGSNVQMRRHREDGRLVLEAVSISNSSLAYFQAERINGCLRLHLVRDSNEAEDEEEEEFEEEEEDFNEGEEEEKKGNGGGEKLTRLSRCKEGGSGNKKMLNWEPLWVAT